MRHGQAVSNVKNIISCWPEKFKNPLTKKGVSQVKASAKGLPGKNIDMIFTSDVLRTKQTAHIVNGVLKVKVKLDKRLREYNVSDFNTKSIMEFSSNYPNTQMRFKNKPKNGETYVDIQKRVAGFLEEIDKKYKGKTILVVSHQLPLALLTAWWKNYSPKQTIDKFFRSNNRMVTAEVRELR